MERVFWIDCARFVAIVLVVLTHAHEQAGVNSEVAKSILYSIDRIGVPIFFMLSGGLILPKAHTISVMTFYRKRIPQFVLLLVLYSILTNFLGGMVKSGEPVSALIDAVTKHNGIIPANYGLAAQMWFMYSIIQLYIITPFLSRLLVNLKTNEIFIFLLICIVFSFIRHTLPAIGLGWNFIGRMGNEFTGSYVSYFITGYLIMNRNIADKTLLGNNLFNIALIVFPAVVVFFLDISNGKIINNIHWYSSSIFLYVSSIGAICLIKRIAHGEQSNIISTIASCSFGIYLIHYVFILSASALCKKLYFNWQLSTLIIFISSLILSLFYSKIMLKWKLTRYLVS